jgi:hypothetical protein
VLFIFKSGSDRSWYPLTFIKQKRGQRETGLERCNRRYFIYVRAPIVVPVLFSHYIVYYESRAAWQRDAQATPPPDIIFWSTAPRLALDISSVASTTYEFT